MHNVNVIMHSGILREKYDECPFICTNNINHLLFFYNGHSRDGFTKFLSNLSLLNTLCLFMKNACCTSSHICKVTKYLIKLHKNEMKAIIIK